jgi:hypothetical protein
MDRVRLGRALGYGARHAGKALVSAVDAAITPAPTSTTTSPAPPGAASHSRAAEGTTRTAERAAEIHRRVVGAGTQARGIGKSVWTPLKTFSSVIWLQVTGTFFTVFALFMGEGVWRLRGSFRAPVSSPETHKVYFYLLVFMGFSYFAISNFVRASLREHR